MTTEKAAAELRAWVAEEARRAREFDAGEHRREAFPQTATGRALAAAPLSRSARGPLAPGPLIVPREPSEGVTKGSGWQVTLTADTTVADGGGDISFGTVETSHGVTVTAPTTELVVPQDCVCSVQHLHLHWTNVDNDAAWKGHSAWAEIRVNGVQVAPRFEAGSSGLSYSMLGPYAMPKMTLSQGDVVTLHVFQDSGSGQPVTGRLSLGMEDPAGVAAEPVDATIDLVTFHAAGNGSQLNFPAGTEAGDLLLAGFTGTHNSKNGTWTWDLSGEGWSKVNQYDTPAVHTSLWQRQATAADVPETNAGLPDSVKSTGAGGHLYQMVRVPQAAFGPADPRVEYPSGVTSMAASGGSLVWFGFAYESANGSPAPTGTTGTVMGYSGPAGLLRMVKPAAGSSGLSWGDLVIGAAFPFNVTDHGTA